METPFTNNKFVQGLFRHFFETPFTNNKFYNDFETFLKTTLTLQFNNKFETFFETPFTLQFNNKFVQEFFLRHFFETPFTNNKYVQGFETCF